ncbi:LLM class flavin-dependent oxidoreductase [Pseudonocardia charpentierae]|uniref:LLM class flavin-dependent oxidoreductase n=1 Tax=Pseudonocardia charpentierae TaxID=3075545 RepID=A0ABU2NFI1_9PSEU|nr:LLM class flavin-dependent oxidoreductase [Pseudonocardia sp. DSM 45834]MDT0352721.1 LLM class flavin-dependent oxidoreductase [Pseudonocardia sp. DSM 45834]
MQVVTTGVVFRPQSPPERLREVVEAADVAGVGELWLWEDCFWEGGLTAAAAALAWSERLRIGIGLLPVALRNPAVVAMEIATLARLFPDRFVPGLGHGVLDWMGQVGARAESPMTLLREHTAAVRDLLHGHRVDVDGRYVHLDGVALEWPPAQPPPLLLGARGPKTLRLAGESADGVILDAAATPDGVRAACAEVDAGRAVAGRADPYQVVVYIEPPVGLADDELADVVAKAVRDLGEAGATSVVFQGSAEAPDPGPLLRAIAA